MTATDIAEARQFVAAAELPEPPPMRHEAWAAAPSSAGSEQATVVGSEVVSFATSVAAQQRQDVVNASLLAQLVAKQKVAAPSSLAEVEAWYASYFDVLTRIGFAIQDTGFAAYQKASEDFEAHEAILDVAASLLGAAPAALALVTSTLQALRKASTGPWITLFNRESQSANTARFQVSVVEAGSGGQLTMTLMAFGLEARSRLTQFLLFKFRGNEVSLQHRSGKVAIDGAVLAGVRDEVAVRLARYARDFVAALPDL
jgi:hypothetical protein